MATRDAKEKEQWAAFAVAALQSYQAEADDLDELVDNMVEVASTFADAMLDAMDARYTEKGRRSKRRGRDEEEDEDE